MSVTIEDAEVQLTLFQVLGLYDEFDYKIPVNIDSHVTAVIAPNGAGKTLCLKLIDSLFKQEWSFFESIVFNAVKYEFSDGTTIVISKDDLEDLPEDEFSNKKHAPLSRIHMYNGDNIWTTILPTKRRRAGRRYDYYLPFLRRIGPEKWVDTKRNVILHSREVEERYSDELPSGLKEFISREAVFEINKFLEPLNCTFIETQRLIVLAEEIEDDSDEDQYFIGQAGKTKFAIEQKAETLKTIIRSELTKYAALSQSLDRTFPPRVIRSAIGPRTTRNIAGELELLDAQRQQYMGVGILDTEDDAPVEMPSEEYNDEAIGALLSVYIDDNKKKLNSLSDIYAKISLFKSLMENRFGKKNIEINKTQGLSVSYSGRAIPVEKLSSGEQHQLVLFFSLLFEIPPNSLILIDEPEISLHIAWQKKFIGDLIEIIKLRHFNVILATHSPQLIGRWTNLVVELGDVYEGDADI